MSVHTPWAAGRQADRKGITRASDHKGIRPQGHQTTRASEAGRAEMHPWLHRQRCQVLDSPCRKCSKKALASCEPLLDAGSLRGVPMRDELGEQGYAYMYARKGMCVVYTDVHVALVCVRMWGSLRGCVCARA